MIISFANQKGGVGKTTTALNIGSYLAANGKKVLLVDLDPQGNLSSGVGVSRSKKDLLGRENLPTIYDVLINDKKVSEVFVATKIENLHILPSNLELAGAEIELVSLMSRETRLKKALDQVKNRYDYILLDCPPTLGLLTVNALSASDSTIIPVQCEYFALEGLSQLMEMVKMVRGSLNPKLDVLGVVLTMYDSRTKLSSVVANEVRKFFKEKVFDTIIPRNIKLSEAPSHGKPISEYKPNSTGGKAYEKLAMELIKRTK